MLEANRVFISRTVSPKRIDCLYKQAVVQFFPGIFCHSFCRLLGCACKKLNNYSIEQFLILVLSCQCLYGPVSECVWCMKNCSVFAQKLKVTFCKGNGVEFWLQSTKFTDALACNFILELKSHTRIGSVV